MRKSTERKIVDNLVIFTHSLIITDVMWTLRRFQIIGWPKNEVLFWIARLTLFVTARIKLKTMARRLSD